MAYETEKLEFKSAPPSDIYKEVYESQNKAGERQ